MIYPRKEIRQILEQARDVDEMARKHVLAGDLETALKYTLTELHLVRAFLEGVFPKVLNWREERAALLGAQTVNRCIVLGETD